MELLLDVFFAYPGGDMAGAAKGRGLPLSPGSGQSQTKDSAFSRMLAAGLRSNVVATMGKFKVCLHRFFRTIFTRQCCRSAQRC